ncbi:peptide deformylase [Sphingobacterium sp. DK4209]|uniref:Peptide deformylase n=1 Tax=Sphingobacterium zhuxiongii TaxID=2662364 RepID=A0A5Q0QCJ1_9SPHI|nr:MULTISPECIES: peptide deformylase [unclassified Sphingobacterium]MVZ65689.1 peptide deformylase [Sphingobacterium sp. DK4209]QGA27887.1 peptide deformylase [Sphingobacterium sp. dk4302]
MRNFIYILFLLLPITASSQDYAQDIASYRKQKDEAYLKNEYGPLKADQLSLLSYYPANKQFITQAKVELLADEPSFRMPTYDGTSNEYKRYALLHFSLFGRNYTLTAYQSIALFQTLTYKDHLFVPFMDESNGNSTYEGGRYLDLSINQIKNNSIEIDFNKAYNPYCAYSNGYRCPQPPKDNILPVLIEAGEKKYKGPKNERKVNISAAKNFSDTEQKLINAADEETLMHVYLISDEKELAVLRKPSEDLKFDDPLIDKLASRMFKTVQDPQHKGVGIAGPQVGINKNVIWVQRFDKTNEPFEFYINPKIIWRSKLIRVGAEGCLSIPDRKEDVKRSYAIRLQYVDRKGNIIEENIEGFTAVIFQHEVDHLYGILYPDRLEEQENKEVVPLNERINFQIEKGTIIP